MLLRCTSTSSSLFSHTAAITEAILTTATALVHHLKPARSQQVSACYGESIVGHQAFQGSSNGDARHSHRARHTISSLLRSEHLCLAVSPVSVLVTVLSVPVQQRAWDEGPYYYAQATRAPVGGFQARPGQQTTDRPFGTTRHVGPSPLSPPRATLEPFLARSRPIELLRSWRAPRHCSKYILASRIPTPTLKSLEYPTRLSVEQPSGWRGCANPEGIGTVFAGRHLTQHR